MPKALPEAIEGVLFDLDGTLADSAPDLYAALLEQCVEEGVATPTYASVREVVSRGSRAILQCAFVDRDEAAIGELVPRYLSIYQAMLARQTAPFDGVEPLLLQLESEAMVWGIVTNKPAFLANELVSRLGWADRLGAMVAGDTLAVKKPDPAPVLLACECAGISPDRAVFVGDDLRDVKAGSAAGLYTVAVSWGYLDGGDPRQWGADAVVDSPAELARLLQQGRQPA